MTCKKAANKKIIIKITLRLMIIIRTITYNNKNMTFTLRKKGIKKTRDLDMYDQNKMR